MQDLISAILVKMDSCPKVKLAKLVLFVEREYFKKHLSSPTGTYYVKKAMGPVPANFDAILDEGKDKLWSMEYAPMDGISDWGSSQPTTHKYTAICAASISPELQEIVDIVIDRFGKYPGNKLSVLSHELPAWLYAESGEPIFIEELALDIDEQYWTFQNIVAEMENGDNDSELQESLPSKLQ